MSCGLLHLLHVELRSPHRILNWTPYLNQGVNCFDSINYDRVLRYSKYSLLFLPVVVIEPATVMWFLSEALSNQTPYTLRHVSLPAQVKSSGGCNKGMNPILPVIATPSTNIKTHIWRYKCSYHIRLNSGLYRCSWFIFHPNVFRQGMNPILPVIAIPSTNIKTDIRRYKGSYQIRLNSGLYRSSWFIFFPLSSGKAWILYSLW